MATAIIDISSIPPPTPRTAVSVEEKNAAQIRKRVSNGGRLSN